VKVTDGKGILKDELEQSEVRALLQMKLTLNERVKVQFEIYDK
jgi:hypothetical protein